MRTETTITPELTLKPTLGSGGNGLLVDVDVTKGVLSPDRAAALMDWQEATLLAESVLEWLAYVGHPLEVHP